MPRVELCGDPAKGCQQSWKEKNRGTAIDGCVASPISGICFFVLFYQLCANFISPYDTTNYTPFWFTLALELVNVGHVLGLQAFARSVTDILLKGHVLVCFPLRSTIVSCKLTTAATRVIQERRRRLTWGYPAD